MRRWLPVLAVLGAVAAVVPAQALPYFPSSGQTSQDWNGCVFASSYVESGQQLKTGTLSFSGGVRCATSVVVLTDVWVVAGAAEATQVGTGVSNPLVGPSGVSVGRVLWHQEAQTFDGQDVLSGSVPRPAAGHVYTIYATSYFSDPCGSFGGPCNPQSGQPSGAAASQAHLLRLVRNQLGSDCQGEHFETYDVGCSYEFTVVGKTLPSA